MSAVATTARGERAVGIVVLLLRLAIGAIFLAAGALKIGHAIEFAQEIAAFGIVPRALVAPMALALPFLEVLLGGYLVLGLFTRAAAWVATGLFALFDAAIASAVIRGLHLSCGCFGPNDKTTTSWAEVARDAVLIVLALIVALRAPGALAVDAKIGNAS